MAPLKNARHERFAQELAKGKSQTEAYRLAGYNAENAEANAYRLMDNDGVKARLAELQSKAAEKTELELVDILTRLERIATKAEGMESPASLAVSRAALMDYAKLTGRVIERKETGAPGDFARMTDDELEDFIASREGRAGGGANRTGH